MILMDFFQASSDDFGKDTWFSSTLKLELKQLIKSMNHSSLVL